MIKWIRRLRIYLLKKDIDFLINRHNKNSMELSGGFLAGTLTSERRKTLIRNQKEICLHLDRCEDKVARLEKLL